MNKEQAEAGPRFESLGSEDEEGLMAYRNIRTGHIAVGVAEFIRLANADAKYGERPRRDGDYDP